jgi:hypothetical protein
MLRRCKGWQYKLSRVISLIGYTKEIKFNHMHFVGENDEIIRFMEGKMQLK